MRRLIVFCLALAILTGAARNSWSQETQEDVQPPDTRLAAKVSLEMPDTTLADLLKEVTDKTQINHRADPEANAWQVRERGLYIFAKDLPVSTIHTLLERLLRYSWKREGAAETPDYVMFQSKDDIALEEKERQKAADKALEKWSSDWKWAIAVCAKLLSKSSKELAKLTDWDEEAISKARFLADLPEQTRGQLVAGEEVRAPYQDMPADLQKAVRGLASTEDFDEDLLKGTKIRINLVKPRPDSHYTPVGWEMEIVYKTDNATNTANITRFLTPIPKRATDALTQEGFLPEGGWEFPDESAPPSDKDLPQIYSENNPPTDPKLLAPVELKVEKAPPSAPKLFGQLSESSGLPILCDSFDGNRRKIEEAEFQGLGMKQPLYKVLNLVAQSIGRIWYYENGAILFKDPRWAERRNWDVPKAWKDYLAARLKEGMTFEDVALFGNFTDDQLNNTLTFDKDLGPYVPGELPMLRFYLSLSDAQKKRIWKSTGLSTASLGRIQRQRMNEMLQYSDLDTMQMGTLRIIKISDKRDDGDIIENVTLDVQFPDGKKSSFTVTLPQPTGKRESAAVPTQ